MTKSIAEKRKKYWKRGLENLFTVIPSHLGQMSALKASNLVPNNVSTDG